MLITFTPHNLDFPILPSDLKTVSGYYEMDVPSNISYLVHIFYSPCDYPVHDCFVPAYPNATIDRIDFYC